MDTDSDVATVSFSLLTANHSYIFRHAGIQPSNVHYVAGQTDPLLHLPVKFKPQTEGHLHYGTGEEQNVSLIQVYEELCKMVRKLSDLPLTITSIQGTSPCFRYAEVRVTLSHVCT